MSTSDQRTQRRRALMESDESTRFTPPDYKWYDHILQSHIQLLPTPNESTTEPNNMSPRHFLTDSNKLSSNFELSLIFKNILQLADMPIIILTSHADKMTALNDISYKLLDMSKKLHDKKYMEGRIARIVHGHEEFIVTISDLPLSLDTRRDVDALQEKLTKLSYFSHEEISQMLAFVNYMEDIIFLLWQIAVSITQSEKPFPDVLDLDMAWRRQAYNTDECQFEDHTLELLMNDDFATGPTGHSPRRLDQVGEDLEESLEDDAATDGTNSVGTNSGYGSASQNSGTSSDGSVRAAGFCAHGMPINPEYALQMQAPTSARDGELRQQQISPSTVDTFGSRPSNSPERDIVSQAPIMELQSQIDGQLSNPSSPYSIAGVSYKSMRYRSNTSVVKSNSSVEPLPTDSENPKDDSTTEIHIEMCEAHWSRDNSASEGEECEYIVVEPDDTPEIQAPTSQREGGSIPRQPSNLSTLSGPPNGQMRSPEPSISTVGSSQSPERYFSAEDLPSSSTGGMPISQPPQSTTSTTGNTSTPGTSRPQPSPGALGSGIDAGYTYAVACTPKDNSSNARDHRSKARKTQDSSDNSISTNSGFGTENDSLVRNGQADSSLPVSEPLMLGYNTDPALGQGSAVPSRQEICLACVQEAADRESTDRYTVTLPESSSMELQVYEECNTSPSNSMQTSLNIQPQIDSSISVDDSASWHSNTSLTDNTIPISQMQNSDLDYLRGSGSNVLSIALLLASVVFFLLSVWLHFKCSGALDVLNYYSLWEILQKHVVITKVGEPFY